MVSQKQRQARKRYREEHPDLFPKPEPTPPKDPSKKKKKESKFKRNKAVSKNPNKPIKRGFGKHPLRVPGMKPGDSCFICKAQDHIAKLCPERAMWEKNKICLVCRRRGHSLKNCPNKSDDTVDDKLCYNCGESGHSLAKCPQPLQDGGTMFASCFICNERGHLSKNCPRNTHGMYPKGGCCKICGGVTHLARDCPNKLSRDSAAAYKGNYNSLTEYGGRPKVTKFLSGDDLEDDFLTVQTIGGNKEEASESAGVPSSDLGDVNTKSKKIKGPKVVNFVG